MVRLILEIWRYIMLVQFAFPVSASGLVWVGTGDLYILIEI